MLLAPVVAWETSEPPTTPRGVSRSGPGLTTFISEVHARELPAGHVDDLAVDEVRPWRAEQEDRARGLLRRARAAERDEHRAHAAQLLGDAELDLLAVDLHDVLVGLRRGEPRLDEPERDRVAVDLELAPLLGQRLRQADDAELARGVVRLPGVAVHAGGGGD